MKKKFTRKVRKNRQTKRRKNRSYKRMRGGGFVFKTKGLFQQENIPTDVKTAINEYKGVRVDIIKWLYEKIIPITEANKLFYQDSTNERPIKDAITRFTARTGEDKLTTLLPVTNTDVLQLIERLIVLQFLPTKEELARLYDLFNREKDTRHRKPFKFNGLALALSLITIYHHHTSQGIGATAAPAAPAAASADAASNAPIAASPYVSPCAAADSPARPGPAPISPPP